MSELLNRIKTLSSEKYGCSQIMVKLQLEDQKIENDQFIRALCGLRGGMCSQRSCGALTGGCCLLGMFVGNLQPNQAPDSCFPEIVAIFANWFEEHFGSTNCGDLVSKDPDERKQRCPVFMKESYEKCIELLEKNGYTPAHYNKEETK